MSHLLLLLPLCASLNIDLNFTDVPISAKCATTEKQIGAKAKAYEIKLENASAKLFEASCHEIKGPPHACNAEFNWTKFSAKIHQYDEVVTSIDKNAKICFIDMNFNMKSHAGSGIAYNYNLQKAGLFPVSASCTADDRNALLLKTYSMLLAHTTQNLPEAVISDVSVNWSDRSCAGPSDCLNKPNYNCFSHDGFCLGDVDRFCAAGTVCSQAFHRKFPDKDPCIVESQTYGCDKTTKKCVVMQGYDSLSVCEEACK